MPTIPPLVLASTSRYRRALLERLRIPFAVDAPGIDEAPLADELQDARAQRLAEQKAREVGARHRGALVLGSDQVAELDGERLDKPGLRAAAIAQLRASAGRTVRFATGLCLFDTRDGSVRHHLDVTLVSFRQLTEAEIERYVDADSPFDCAGAFRSESLGAALVQHMRSDDPTGLIGLPLIATARLLREAGLDIP